MIHPRQQRHENQSNRLLDSKRIIRGDFQ